MTDLDALRVRAEALVTYGKNASLSLPASDLLAILADLASAREEIARLKGGR